MMKTIKALFVSTALLTLIGGCAKKSTSEINMNVTVANIVQLSSIQGGIFLMIQGSEGTTEYFDIPESHKLSLPTGVFDMYFIAYQGPNPWKGQKYCGHLTNTNIQGAELTLQVSLASSLCGTNPAFNQMDLIKNPIYKWDAALWDSGNWGP